MTEISPTKKKWEEKYCALAQDRIWIFHWIKVFLCLKYIVFPFNSQSVCNYCPQKNHSQEIKVVIEPEFGSLFNFYNLREFQFEDNGLASLLIYAPFIIDKYNIAQWLGAKTLKPDCLSSKVGSNIY